MNHLNIISFKMNKTLFILLEYNYIIYFNKKNLIRNQYKIDCKKLF